MLSTKKRTTRIIDDIPTIKPPSSNPVVSDNPGLQKREPQEKSQGFAQLLNEMKESATKTVTAMVDTVNHALTKNGQNVLEDEFLPKIVQVITEEETEILAKLDIRLEALESEITEQTIKLNVEDPQARYMIGLREAVLEEKKSKLQQNIRAAFAQTKQEIQTSIQNIIRTAGHAVAQEMLEEVVSGAPLIVVQNTLLKKLNGRDFHELTEKEYQRISDFTKRFNKLIPDIQTGYQQLNQEIEEENRRYREEVETQKSVIAPKKIIENMSLVHMAKQKEEDEKHEAVLEKSENIAAHVTQQFERLETLIKLDEPLPQQTAAEEKIKKIKMLRIEIDGILHGFSEEEKQSYLSQLGQIEKNIPSEETIESYRKEQKSILITYQKELKDNKQVKRALGHLVQKNQSLDALNSRFLYARKKSENGDEQLLRTLPANWRQSLTKQYEDVYQKYYFDAGKFDEEINQLEALKAELEKGIAIIRRIVVIKAVVRAAVEAYLKNYANRDLSHTLAKLPGAYFSGLIPATITSSLSVVTDKAYAVADTAFKASFNGVGYYRAHMMIVNFGISITQKQYDLLTKDSRYPFPMLEKHDYELLAKIEDTYHEGSLLSESECCDQLAALFSPKSTFFASGKGEGSLRKEMIRQIIKDDETRGYFLPESKIEEVDTLNEKKVDEYSNIIANKFANSLIEQRESSLVTFPKFSA
jgi:hypothetical protein